MEAVSGVGGFQQRLDFDRHRHALENKKVKAQKAKEIWQAMKEATRRKGRRRQSTGSKDDDEDICDATGCLKSFDENVDWAQCDGGCDNWFHIIIILLMSKVATMLCELHMFGSEQTARLSANGKLWIHVLE